MGFKCGIVGLPNVGKSTLFNALTASKNAEAANFPFCTIDPNIGIVDVIDQRLDQLTKLSNSKKKIYTNITFVDIAGLVKGASKGEGLGNKFLSHIREVDAIIHLVRCFESDQITHVNSKINPVEDLETIKTEIILSDIDVIQKKLDKGKKKLLDEKEIKILTKLGFKNPYLIKLWARSLTRHFMIGRGATAKTQARSLRGLFLKSILPEDFRTSLVSSVG